MVGAWQGRVNFNIGSRLGHFNDSLLNAAACGPLETLFSLISFFLSYFYYCFLFSIFHFSIKISEFYAFDGCVW